MCKLCRRDWLRIECKPQGYPFSTDPRDWVVSEDEGSATLPSWYDREEWAKLDLPALTTAANVIAYNGAKINVSKWSIK